jgi:Flp pilus assembly pilin Flp
MRYLGASIATRMLALWATREQGATAVEYALLAVFIAAVIVTGVVALGTKTTDLFTRANAGW